MPSVKEKIVEGSAVKLPVPCRAFHNSRRVAVDFQEGQIGGDHEFIWFG
jgi:hypothetical protein